MQVPRPSGGDTRMDELPGVRVGAVGGAEHFGGVRARELQGLAGAMGGVGDSLLGEAIRRRRIEDDAFVTNAVNQAHLQYADLSKSLFDNLKGEKAVDAPEEVTKILQTMRGGIERNLRTKNQKNLFSGAWNAFAKNAELGAIKYRDVEIENFRNTSLAAQNQLILQDATAAVTQPGGIDAVLGPANRVPWALEAIIQNTYKKNEGQPPEAVELEVRAATEKFYTEQLNALATESPEAALDFLSRDKVREGIPKAKYKRYVEAFGQSRDLNAASRAAMTDVESGQYDPAGLMRRAFELFPDNLDARQSYLATADNYDRRKEMAAKAETVQKRAETWGAWAATGYDIERVPAAAAGDPELLGKMIDFGNKFSKAAGGGMRERAVPAYSALLDVARMPMDQRLAHLENPENFEKIMAQCGGDNELYKRVADGTLESYLNGGKGGSGNGTGTGGGAVKFDLDKAFQNNFLVMRGSPGIGTVWDADFDQKDPSHQKFYDNFAHQYNLRMQDPASFPGKSPESRPEDVFYRLVRDINDGAVDISKPTYEEFMRGSDDGKRPAVSVPANELGETEKTINRGEPAVAEFDPAAGRMVRWGVLDVDSSDANNGVFVDLVGATSSAKVAYERGTLDIGGQTLAYEPGWRIVVMKHSGYTKVYDQGWNFKGELPPAPGNAAEPPAATGKQAYPPPAMSRVMEREIADLRERHPPGKVLGQWTGDVWFFEYPGGYRTYSRNGELLGEQSADAASQPSFAENFEPPEESEEDAVRREYDQEVARLRDLESEMDLVKEYKSWNRVAKMNMYDKMIRDQKARVKAVQTKYAGIYGSR